jgi:uncharacterized protein YecT (DUF1311 family)
VRIRKTTSAFPPGNAQVFLVEATHYLVASSVIKYAINSGSISSSSREELEKFVTALCHSKAYTFFGEREFPQICEAVRLQLLKQYIDSAEKRASKYQWLVRGTFVFLMLSGFSGSVMALEKCSDALTQGDLNKCAASELESADKELNELYEQQMEYLTSDGKSSLKAAQLAWIKFRDLACEYEAPYHQGSMWPMQVILCQAKYTGKRVEDLKGYVSCRQNGCPE